MRKTKSNRPPAGVLLPVLLGVLALAACQPQVSRSPRPAAEWAADAVWYQIFPERFRNGDPSNDPTAERVGAQAFPGWRPHPWGSGFYQRQPWEENIYPEDFYWMQSYRRYGGDLQGIIDQLDYLQDLGITALYLNPVFDANSYHKYDGNTYHHIDYFFGPDPAGDMARVAAARETEDPATWVWTRADSLFLKLLSEAHRRGIRVTTDGVFNHIGRDFFAFQDVIKNQQDSPYADWFEITSWDNPETPENEFDYKGWWGIKSLPEIREERGTVVDGPKQYIFAAVKRWMDPNGDGDPSDGIDGWRLDVVSDMGLRWWREWHAWVRRINPEIYTTAEVWDTRPDLLTSELFTATMNYPFAMAVLEFVGGRERKLSPSAFDRRLAATRRIYGQATSLVLQNLVTSHDTDRLGSLLINPDRNYDRQARPDQNPDGYDISRPGPEARRLQRLVAALQMTYVGAPMIYYGDEVGMWGEDDPGSRKPMLWDDIKYDNESRHPLGLDRPSDPVAPDTSLRAFYRRIIQLRKRHPALRRGSYETILLDDSRELFGFRRWTAGDEDIVVVNNSDQSQTWTLPGNDPVSLGFTLGKVELTPSNQLILEGRSFALLEK